MSEQYTKSTGLPTTKYDLRGAVQEPCKPSATYPGWPSSKAAFAAAASALACSREAVMVSRQLQASDASCCALIGFPLVFELPYGFASAHEIQDRPPYAVCLAETLPPDLVMEGSVLHRLRDGDPDASQSSIEQSSVPNL